MKTKEQIQEQIVFLQHWLERAIEQSTLLNQLIKKHDRKIAKLREEYNELQSQTPGKELSADKLFEKYGANIEQYKHDLAQATQALDAKNDEIIKLQEETIAENNRLCTMQTPFWNGDVSVNAVIAAMQMTIAQLKWVMDDEKENEK